MSGGRGPSGGNFRGSRPGGSSYASGRPPLISQPPPRTDILRGPPPGGVSIPPPGIPGISIRLPPPTSIAAPPPHILTGPPPRVGVLPPHAHVNPAFFASGAAPGYPPPSSGLSGVEFEEIMARNRTVSSSAIARAVQDAAANDFASAIETLVTAISLIKESKVAHDERCRILITSLQDTLHGIESKSYGAGRSRRRSGSPRPHYSDRHRRSYSPHEERYHSSRRHHDDRRHEEYDRRPRSRSPDRREHRREDYRREEKYYDERYKHRESESRGERSSREEARGERSVEKERDQERRSRH